FSESLGGALVAADDVAADDAGGGDVLVGRVDGRLGPAGVDLIRRRHGDALVVALPGGDRRVIGISVERLPGVVVVAPRVPLVPADGGEGVTPASADCLVPKLRLRPSRVSVRINKWASVGYVPSARTER